MRGTNYSSDRNFTNYVHLNLAIPIIYAPLGWLPKVVDSEYAEKSDIDDGIDYFFIDKETISTITTQERFRSVEYKKYNDFTIRFEREYNSHEDRKLSEYYKIKADYFVYGILDVDKNSMHEASNFVKYAVVDLKKVKKLMDENKIVVDRSLGGLVCCDIGGIMHCPVNYNRDRSSSFFPIDICLLIKMFPEDKVVLKQYGFV